MKSGPFILAWLVTFFAMFFLNGIFHGLIAASFFDSQLVAFGSVVRSTSDFNPAPIIILELLLDLCLLLIVTRFRNERIVVKESVLIGGLLYLSTSATWSLANAATFIAWPHTLTVVDCAWHFVSGLLAGWIVAALFNRQFRTK